MRFIRVVIVGLAGALMSMAAVAAPAEHAPVAVQLSSPSVESVASVPQPNFDATFHIAASANHATASASVERLHPNNDGKAMSLNRDPDYNAPAMSVVGLTREASPGAGSPFRAAVDPHGDDGDGSDGMRSLVALADPADDDEETEA